mmetsp:Transcript_43852/g.113497  ORF Transcript_43852/g.113497 Transcript_43852/m.113497 type:complete len:123 (+) Transcript_43852:2055-2423(+)
MRRKREQEHLELAKCEAARDRKNVKTSVKECPVAQVRWIASQVGFYASSQIVVEAAAGNRDDLVKWLAVYATATGSDVNLSAIQAETADVTEFQRRGRGGCPRCHVCKLYSDEQSTCIDISS